MAGVREIQGPSSEHARITVHESLWRDAGRNTDPGRGLALVSLAAQAGPCTVFRWGVSKLSYPVCVHLSHGLGGLQTGMA